MINSPGSRRPLSTMALSALFAACALAVACGTSSSGTKGGSGGTSGADSGGTKGSGGGIASSGGNASAGSGGSASGGVQGPGSGGTVPAGSGGTAASSGGSPGSGGTASGGATSSGGRGAAGGAPSSGTGGALAGASGSAGATGSGGRTGVLRIMPLGDSTTGSVCYRAYLWFMLNGAGHTGKFDFVGSNKNNSDPKGATCAPANADPDNEGHPSCLVTEIVDNVSRSGCDTTFTALKPALMNDKADIVLMHFGTNDVWNSVGSNTKKILDADGAIIDYLRTVNPNVVVLIAKIIPMNVTSTTCSGCSCAACGTNIDMLNGILTAWAATKSNATSSVIVVDQFTGFDAVADTVDGVHPNESGSTKIATKWAAALASYF